ncbi:hypothetical protein JCM10449v2_007782 [Rhodotorula kratochvilovae]
MRSHAGRAAVLSAVFALSSLVSSAAAFLQIQDTKHWFAFGDSWTADGFNATAGFDVTKQPLKTSAGGKTWLDEITFSPTFPQLNAAHYNFAVGGSTVWPEMRTAGFPNVSFPDQVGWFVKNVTEGSSADKPKWESSSSLFSVFFGINDINLQNYQASPIDKVLNATFKAYDESISRLYAHGARNFLLLNVPNFDRAPVSELLSTAAQGLLPAVNASIATWNARLAAYAAEMPSKYPGAEVEVYDIASWLDETLDKIEASNTLISDDWCESYRAVSSSYLPDVPPDLALPDCPAPLKQYVWIDGSHPSWTIHRLLAYDIVRALSSTAHHSSFTRRATHLSPILAHPRLGHAASARRPGHGRGQARAARVRLQGREVPSGPLFG